jgi:hypothetical protein
MSTGWVGLTEGPSKWGVVMSRDTRGAKSILLAGAVFAMLLVTASLGAGRAIAAGGEFSDPSPNAPPAASVFNTTPSCPLTAADGYACVVPTSAWPPQDPDNPDRYLNSAYWPGEKRPDITMYATLQYGYSYQNCSAKMTHYCVLLDAQASGYPTTHTPQVGDLWFVPGECFAVGPGAAVPGGCTDDANDWYDGYVDEVFPDGSFIASSGGSTTAADSGLYEYWFSGAMDPYADFIGFFPSGQSPSIPVNVLVFPGNGVSLTVHDSNGQTCTAAVSEVKCVFTEPEGVPVTFTSPQSGSTISLGGNVACGGSGPCTVTFDGTNAGKNVYAEFAPPDSGGGSSGSPAGTGGSGAGPGSSGTSGIKPRIARVRTGRGVIHATLTGSHLVCKLSRWNGRRWVRLDGTRHGTSVTYRHLKAGRYRLTVVSGKLSATKIVTLRKEKIKP